MRYVDVNVIVYWLGDDPIFGERATEIAERIEGGEKAVTSSLTIWLAHIVLSNLAERYSSKELLERIKGLVFLRVEPLLLSDYERAVELVGEYGLDLEDAVHLAVALRVGAEEIYSADSDFDVTPLRRVGF
ncbi:TPA: PIN domain-containing protein [Candidatus Bathyarchaeota archaeon]|nr:PIN domain-containing protein [Candidatus Bathyarchaeota archaeon]